MLLVLEDHALVIFGFSIVLPLAFAILSKPLNAATYASDLTTPKTSRRLAASSQRLRRPPSILFPLMSLPDEITIIILAMVIDTDTTRPSASIYRQLSLVSRHFHRLICPAGLPFVHVYIRISEDLNSFHSFLLADPRRPLSIRRLRINPSIPLSKYEEEILCVFIVRSCEALKYLACHARVLEKINHHPHVHTQCSRLVVFAGGHRAKDVFLATPNMKQLLSQGAQIDFP